MLRLAFDFIITWRETRTRPNAYGRRTKYNRQISLTRQRAFMLSHLTSKGEATESIKN
ncbi:hypothetical protein PHVU103714_01040 [Phocaeicola vulgatus]|jgi:hypothetical protein